MASILKRIAHNAANPVLRGKVVQVAGHRGATHWDNARMAQRPTGEA